MLKEFKKFIDRGNVLELAVGLIMGTYFGAIVKSLVNDIIMPPVGKAMGGVNFANIKYVIQEAIAASEATGIAASPEIAITYGNFINSILTFIIVAFSVFFALRAYNKMKERQAAKQEKEEAAAPPPEPTKEEVLLTEIRDLLKAKE